MQVLLFEDRASMKLNILPAALVGLRAAIAPFLLWDAWDGTVTSWFLWAYGIGVLSDVLDGVVARRLGVSTPGLRQADSWTDVVFYLCVFTAAWQVHPEMVTAFRGPLLTVVGAQLLWWGVNLAKYGKPASYHTYSAKAWGIALAIATMAFFGWGYGGLTLGLAIGLGLIHTVEEIVMTLLLPTWQHDVLSVVHALRLRRELTATP